MEETTKVHNPTPLQRKFKQVLRYDDHGVVLQTGMLPSTDVKIMHNQYGDYILIPVSPYIRHQLDIIEEYVTLNMDIPTPLAQEWKARDDKDTPYRKIWDGNHICLPVSHWCTYYKKDGDHSIPIRCDELGEGTWDILFKVNGLYYGRHKDNKIASLSMHMESILYIPKPPNVDDIIDQILNSSGTKRKSEKNATSKRKSKKENC